MDGRLLTVEIHDVSPATLDEVAEIGAGLASIGVDRASLLVVPNFLDEGGHHWDLRGHARAVDFLQDRQSRGWEIIQHGLTHRAPGPPPPGWTNAFMHHLFSRGCAEFAHLSARQARERLEAGLNILAQCGLTVQGFIAPAWQQSAASIRVLQRMGYRFTAFLNKVLPLESVCRPVHTFALTFDASGKWIDFAKRAAMRMLERLSRDAPILRVALHPADLYGARPLNWILSRIRALLRHRQLTTYREWLP